MPEYLQPDCERIAGQIAAVLSATIHINVVWRANITTDSFKHVVRRWASIIEREADDERIIHYILEDLAGLDAAFRTAWLLLTNSQRTSCSNAMRNILFEHRTRC
jgi:hypothetical protein